MALGSCSELETQIEVSSDLGFVDASEKSIEKEANVDGIYYIAPTYNELVLNGSKLKAYRINSNQYHSFFSFPKIREFEKQNIKILDD